jgi:hypothetical protein
MVQVAIPVRAVGLSRNKKKLVKYMSLNALNRIRSPFSTFAPVKSFIHVNVHFTEWRDALIKINS